MVIIDVPPLNPVADAQVLLNNPVINGAILVARVDRTTHEEMRVARSILDHHMVEPVGIVVTGVRDTGNDGYGYGPYEAAGSAVDVDIEAQAGRSGRLRDEQLKVPAGSGSGSSLRRTSN
jgi:Mrp family chromosome partitioning ATPase